MWQDRPAQSATFPENIEPDISNCCSLHNHSRLDTWNDLVSDMWGKFFWNSKDSPVFLERPCHDTQVSQISPRLTSKLRYCTCWNANRLKHFVHTSAKTERELVHWKIRSLAKAPALFDSVLQGQNWPFTRLGAVQPRQHTSDASAASITCCKALGKPRNRAQRWPKKRDQSQIKGACSRQLGWRGLKDRLTTQLLEIASRCARWNRKRVS